MPIYIKNISKNFGTFKVLDGFSVELPDFGTVSLVGRSGIGKTTILNIIAQILLPDSGSISGLDAKKVSFVFQDERLLVWDSVIENVIAVLNDNAKNKPEIAKMWLKRVGLDKVCNKKPGQLSGGMKQRLSIARALAFDADILLLDEPFKALDLNAKNLLMDLIREYTKNKLVVMVTHDIDDALRMSDILYILKGTPAKVIKKLDINLTSEQIENHSEDFINYKNIINSLI